MSIVPIPCKAKAEMPCEWFDFLGLLILELVASLVLLLRCASCAGVVLSLLLLSVGVCCVLVSSAAGCGSCQQPLGGTSRLSCACRRCILLGFKVLVVLEVLVLVLLASRLVSGCARWSGVSRGVLARWPGEQVVVSGGRWLGLPSGASRWWSVSALLVAELVGRGM